MGRASSQARLRLLAVTAVFVILIALFTSHIAHADQAYVVQPGDTLSTIAVRFGTTVEALMQANTLANPHLLSIGQVLIIPDQGSPPAAQPPTVTPISEGLSVGSNVPVFEAPSTNSRLLGYLRERERVRFNAAARGENWIIGDQGWVGVRQDWTDLWYHLETGGWVYAAWIFFPRQDEVSPLDPGPGERWVQVNLTTQTLRAMVGERTVLEAPVTTGVGEWATPTGSFRINLRIENERMTSVQAGITNDYYDVSRVLFTQYFTHVGHALHLNYWRPESIFGHTPTSHGCVGLLLHDAQFLWLFGTMNMRVDIVSSMA